MQIQFKKVNPNAKTPTRNIGDQGFDLFSVEEKTILPGQRELIDTGIQIEFPLHYDTIELNGRKVYVNCKRIWGMIKSRSGLASKNNIDVQAGIVDNIYRGVVKVLLHNNGDIPYTVYPGDKIAQMIIMQDYDYEFVEVEEVNETERGAGGFGSTGK